MARNATRKVDFTEIHQVSADVFELATTNSGRRSGHSQMVRSLKKVRDGFFMVTGRRPSHLNGVAKESGFTIATLQGVHPVTEDEGFWVIRIA